MLIDKNINYRFTAFILIALFAIFSAIYNCYLPLYLDEAYYWLWSRHLDFGYMDHPFMIALLIKAFTLFGDQLFAIRGRRFWRLIAWRGSSRCLRHLT